MQAEAFPMAEEDSDADQRSSSNEVLAKADGKPLHISLEVQGTMLLEIWVEAGHGGKHCILHTSHGKEEVLVTVAALARSYPRLFLQCHQSFLVNPHYIRSIRRFQVTLTNGTVLPIPEKKYTAFRREVETVLRNEQSG